MTVTIQTFAPFQDSPLITQCSHPWPPFQDDHGAYIGQTVHSAPCQGFPQFRCPAVTQSLAIGEAPFLKFGITTSPSTQRTVPFPVRPTDGLCHGGLC